MNFLEKVLTPIEVKIISSEKISETSSKVKFEVTFQITLFLYERYFPWRRIYFATLGTFATQESIDQTRLTKILNETDYHKYVERNMKYRDWGSFNYSYLDGENEFVINYETF